MIVIAGLAVWYRYSQGFASLLEYFIFVAIILLLVVLDLIIKKKVGYSTLSPKPHSKILAKAGRPLHRIADSVFKILLAVLLGMVLVAIGVLSYYQFFDNQQEATQESTSPNFLEVEVNDYSISFPETWKSEKISDQHFSLSVDARTVAFLTCPMPEQGFEAWNFDKQTRSFEANGIIYGVDLWIGTAKTSNVEDLSLIFMHRGSFDEWYEDGNYQYSCYMQFDGDIADIVLKSIFENIDGV